MAIRLSEYDRDAGTKVPGPVGELLTRAVSGLDPPGVAAIGGVRARPGRLGSLRPKSEPTPIGTLWSMVLPLARTIREPVHIPEGHRRRFADRQAGTDERSVGKTPGGWPGTTAMCQSSRIRDAPVAAPLQDAIFRLAVGTGQEDLSTETQTLNWRDTVPGRGPGGLGPSWATYPLGTGPCTGPSASVPRRSSPRSVSAADRRCHHHGCRDPCPSPSH